MPSVKDIRKSLSETRKVLKKNGRLIAVFPSLEAVLYKAMLAYDLEIEHRLKEAGFKNIRFSKIEYPWRIFCEKYFMKFKNKPKMWDWVVEAKK